MPDEKLFHQVQMSFGEHLEELRHRLWLSLIGVVAAVVVCFIFGDQLVSFLKAPVVDALKSAGEPDPRLHMFNFMDAFVIYIKVVLVTALFISSPWIGWQLWQFVTSGLYPTERKHVYAFAPFTVGLFLAGGAFSYLILVRFGIRFLIKFGIDMGVKPLLNVDTNLMFVLLISLVMGLVFQLPLVMLILVKIGVVESQGFVRKRKIFIIVALTIAAIITPTQDAMNLALATAPILVLYELGIWICRIAERRRAKTLAG